MTAPETPPPALQLRTMTFVAQLTFGILYAAAQLRIADHLAQGPRTSDEVARLAGTHPRATYRLLRALTVPGLVREEPGQRFALTPLGQALRSDVPDSARDTVLFAGMPMRLRAWERIADAVRQGKPQFEAAHRRPLFDYMPEHPDEAATFDAAMTAVSVSQAAAVVQAYDFRPYQTIVDVGGGRGHLLATVLASAPRARGILAELPHVADAATASLTERGLAGRIEVVTGDMFETVPGGGDLYMMKLIAHDWDDAACATLLRNVRKVLPPHGKLLVLDAVVPDPGVADLSKLLDLEMLVLPGGQERTRDEFAALLAQAGLMLARIVPTVSSISIIEAVPA